MKTPFRRRLVSPLNFVLFFGLCIIAVVGLALPTVHSSSSTSEGASAGNRAGSRFFGATLVPGYGNWMPAIATPSPGDETIEIFAADCTTPQTAFAAGETICAKTNGVDLTTPGNYYVNWFHPDSSETNGGTITTNPQYTLFSIPTSGSYLGTWKANIGRVTPAEGSIIGLPPLFTVSAAPTIATFAYNTLGLTCTNTPKTNFVVGETVCARTVGVDPQFNRRFAWVDADHVTREFTPITTDPATDDYAIILAETSIGTWKANVVSSRGTTVVGTPFTVSALTASVDLSIGKSLSTPLKSGEDATFTISVYSRGPNDAENVIITDVTPANAMFVSANQTEGSGFTCTGTSTVTCNSAIMKPGERAVFEFVYTPGAAGQTITNTATVESDTPEVVAGQDTDGDNIDDASEDNSATAGPYTISPGSGSPGDCTLDCPEDINAIANTTEGSQRGAHVSFNGTTTGTCGTVTSSPASGDFFPVGTTTVTSNSELNGGTCTFTITVEDQGIDPPTITCPANPPAANANDDCEAVVTITNPTVTGHNVTFSGTRSDGKPMYNCDCFPHNPDTDPNAPAWECDVDGTCSRRADAPFQSGTTTITWIAHSHSAPGPYANPDDEIAHRTGAASCTVTVVVYDTTDPEITAESSTVSADANCQAAVPDYSNDVSDNCSCSSTDDSEDCRGRQRITLTQTPAAGTMVGIGPHTIHLEANDHASNPGPDGIPETADDGTGNVSTKDITFTVKDTTAPTIHCPGDITTDTEPGTCAAHVDHGTATATDNCDTNPIITGTRSDGRPLDDTYPKGTTTITWTASDHASPANQSTCMQTITVEDHEKPVIVCPAPIVQGTDPGTCSATVTTGQPTATDNCDNPTITSSRSDGQDINAPYPKGTTTITWRATDSSGNYKECTQTVTVFDNEAPTFTFTGTQTMWPPNHKYWTFPMTALVASVHDNCDGNIPVSSVVITKVTSDEIENGNGDGNTLNDIVIAANCKSVQLRSEREGNSNGRVYTIFFSVTDAAGNKGTGTTKVVVPHNPGETAVDSGPHYTVTSNCP